MRVSSFAQGAARAFAALPMDAPDWQLPFADAVGVVRKGTWSRVTFAVLVAPIASIVLPALWLFAWVVFLAAWEFFVRPFLEDRVAAPIAAKNERSGFAWLAAINVFGAFSYSVFPLAAWLTGESLGMVIATGWVCGSANHLFVYFSNHRWLLLSCLIPLMICAIAAPFLAEGEVNITSAVGALVLILIVAAGGIFGFDRRFLLQALSRQAMARAAAEQANVAKSQFLATMSHELRTPLNSVIGYAELITEEAEGALAEDARKISESAKKLLGIVNVILDISRLETGDVSLQRESFEAAAIVEQLREAAAVLAKVNKNRFAIIEATPLGEAEIDPARLYQALMQLVSNAAKFTSNGEIEVTARRERRDGREVLTFTVRDTGIGIALDQHERIFEPFVQAEQDADRRHEGAGLGLSFARQVARLMGGDVNVTSAPGQGATFTLWVNVKA
ncbi:two-component hybrid sensor and regulator [alpha proteobacterium U9-1i]|nr:two-component hybrid sensor and regulator [alpha proteobacterium U9-1i]